MCVFWIRLPAGSLTVKGPTKATATTHSQLRISSRRIFENLDNYQRHCESYTDNGPYIEYDMLLLKS